LCLRYTIIETVIRTCCQRINCTFNSPINVETHLQLSKSDIFGVLQNDRRRCALEILRTQGRQSIRSLSEEIAHIESQSEEPKNNLIKSIYVSLLQTHIPKMESMGIIVYNREQDIVELLPASQDFEIYLETVEKGDIPWSQFYLGLSIFTFVGNIMIYLEIINWISSYKWIFFTSSLFVVASLVHIFHVRKIEK
jgi:hypothetical protein